jgi:hypothetical protein
VDLVATYHFVPGAAVPIEVPASDAWLTVESLRSEPATRERFLPDGRRLLVPAPETAELRIYCRCRIYRRSGAAAAPDPASLFPGAVQVDRYLVP